jgi:multimeric flavodoxin WrbA
MKALILQGSEKPGALPDIVTAILERVLADTGWQTDLCNLREHDIAPCMGCFGCWTRTPGICMINDFAREIARLMVESSLMALVTPVTFGGYSSELKKALDRLIPNILPLFTQINGEIHHIPRYDRYPALLALGTLPQKDPEAEEIFTHLVSRNAINTYSPVHTSLFIYEYQTPEVMKSQISGALIRMGYSNERS